MASKERYTYVGKQSGTQTKRKAAGRPGVRVKGEPAPAPKVSRGSFNAGIN